MFMPDIYLAVRFLWRSLHTGSHKVHVRFADKSVRDSPFDVNVYNDPKVRVPDSGEVGKPVILECKC